MAKISSSTAVVRSARRGGGLFVPPAWWNVILGTGDRVPATAGDRVWAYQPALDGVRALAVAAVLVFHARPDWLPGGFLGVDAFFVLSGFLITSLLLTEQRLTGGIRLVAFWGRRARRLLPALLLVLVVTVGISRLVLAETELSALRHDAFAALGYVANWRMIYRGGDYFAATGPASLLQHTWSLGIEEQFYLIWPLLVLLAVRGGRPRSTVLAISVAGAIASTVVAVLLYRPDADPGRVYYGTDARASALLLGCALAAVLAATPPPTGARARRLLALAAVPAIAFVGWAWARADGEDAWLYRGGLTALAAAVAVVLGYLVWLPSGWGARVLSTAPLVWLGRVSYGVYLWHWPLYGLLTADRTGQTGVVLAGLRMAATLLVAAASFYLVEQPIRRGRLAVRWLDSTVRRRTAVTGGAVAALAATVAVVLVATAAPPVPRAEAATEAPPLAPPAATSPTGAPVDRIAAPITRPGRRPGALPRVTFLGDSVSWSVAAYLPSQPDLAMANRTTPGCGIARLPEIRYGGGPHPNREGCDRWDDRWRAAVNLDDPDLSVILLDRWELMDRRLDGRYQHVGEPQFDAYLASELSLAITIAAGLGGRVLLLTAPYTRRIERPDGGLWPEDTPDRVDAWNLLLHDTAADHPAQPVVLDLNRVACPEGRFTWEIDGVRIRSDGLHFTPAGVRRFIAPWLMPHLHRLATLPLDADQEFPRGRLTGQ